MDRSLNHSRHVNRDLTFVELLREAGVIMRGARRATCPECKGRYTLSINFEKEVFRCHNVQDGHACDFRGGTVVLQRRIGLYERLPPAEYAELMRNLEKKRRLAALRAQENRETSILLRGRLRQFDRMESWAHKQGRAGLSKGRKPGRVVWDALAVVYRKRDMLIEKLDRVDGLVGRKP